MKKWIALLLILTLLLGGCSGQESSYTAEQEQNTEKAGMTESKEVAVPEVCIEPVPWENARVADFGARLLRETMEEDKNTLISPVSVLTALSMTANGAEGDTLAQMETVLGQSKDALNAWYKYDTDKSGDYLHLANAVFIEDDPELTVKESFARTVEKWYETDIVITDFNERALADINRYVEDNTNGMVKNILDKIPEEAVMYLVNALSFDAKWMDPYYDFQVRERTFTTESGEKQDVEIMFSEDWNCYLEDEKATGFYKRYENGNYAFVALLPKEGVTVAEYVEGLTGAHLQQMLENPQEVQVNTGLLKFETGFETELSQTLIAMGMTDAFDLNRADFSGIGTYHLGSLHISRVLHKTFICVAEEGTRAAAATLVEIAPEAAPPGEEPKTVILDRPFLYMIVDTSSNTPIFMGTLMGIQ